MEFAEKVGFVLLFAAFVVQCAAHPRFPLALRRVWAMGIVGIGGTLASQAYAVYAGWQGSELGKFFLPPYQPFAYFFGYVGERLFAPWGAALAAAVLAVWIARRMNQRYGGRFFESEEPMLIGLCFFMSGYPAFFFYLAAMLVVGAGVSAVYQLHGWGRAPLYYWWVPVALSVILLKVYLVPQSVLTFFVL
ncbi:MAG: hypothetical protein HYW65_03415 [Candidatus Liptonbacteria bacterium]|nr:hypothetical protein [Candidatus Liptonbacteria bacterium]MBI3114478.1 hypothetical protein [Candidatus Harrisonbacteria bacterium]